MHTSGEPVSTIAATLGVSRATMYRVLAEQDDDRKQSAQTAGQMQKPVKTVTAQKNWQDTVMAYIRTQETRQRARGKPVKRLPHRQHHPGFRRRHPRSRGARLGTVHAGRPAQRRGTDVCLPRRAVRSAHRGQRGLDLAAAAGRRRTGASLFNGLRTAIVTLDYDMALAYFKSAIIAAGIDFRSRMGGSDDTVDQVGERWRRRSRQASAE